MRGLSKSEKMLITVLLVMLVGYVYYQYIITPVSSKVQSTQSNVGKYEQELLQSKLMAANNKKMAEEMDALKANYEKYVKLMPKSDMSAEIIREVNRLAVDNKVTLSSLTLGNGVEYKLSTGAANTAAPDNNNSGAGAAQNTAAKSTAAKVMAIPVSININGDYNSFISFINSLENSNRIVNINSINVTKPGTEAAGGILTVALSVNMLYVQEGTVVENKYDFNNGNYSKVNPFMP